VLAEKPIRPKRLTTEDAEFSTIRRVQWEMSQWVCTSIRVRADSGWLWTPFDHVRHAQPGRFEENQSRAAGYPCCESVAGRGLGSILQSAARCQPGVVVIPAPHSLTARTGYPRGLAVLSRPNHVSCSCPSAQSCPQRTDREAQVPT
jgi:hypothetical protein